LHLIDFRHDRIAGIDDVIKAKLHRESAVLGRFQLASQRQSFLVDLNLGMKGLARTSDEFDAAKILFLWPLIASGLFDGPNAVDPEEILFPGGRCRK
jgi:hypothetical protein